MQRAQVAPTGRAHRQRPQAVCTGRTHRQSPQAARTGSAHSQRPGLAHRRHPGSAHGHCTQAARTQAAHRGSALDHKSREHEIGAGPTKIGQERQSWAEPHGRVQTHGPTPIVMTVGKRCKQLGLIDQVAEFERALEGMIQGL